MRARRRTRVCRRSGGRSAALLAVVAALVLSACDGFFFDPAPPAGATVAVAFRTEGPALQPAAQDAFDRLDAARILLRQSGGVLFDDLVPLVAVTGGLVAEIEVDAGSAAGPAVLEAELRAEGDPLFEGETSIELAPGLPVDATVPLTLVDDPPVVQILTPTPATVVVEGVRVTLSAVATDKPDGDITDQIVWSVDGSDLDLGGGTIETSLGAGERVVTARVTDSGGNTSSASVTVTVLDRVAVSTTSLSDGRVGEPYEAALAATGGDGTYAWTLAAGSLPPGIALSAEGRLSGTPSVSGTFDITVRVTSAGGSATRALRLVVAERAPPRITVEALPDAVIGLPYGVQLTAVGGDGSYTWRLIDSFLPVGLQLSSGGAISGIPTGPTGTRSLIVEVESAGQTDRAVLALEVVAPLTVVPTSLPDAEVDLSYSFQFDAIGGDGVYTWSLVDGVVPPGLTLDDGGLLSGVPIESGSYLFTVQVRSAGQTASRQVELAVAPGLAPSELAWIVENRTPGVIRFLNAATRQSLGTLQVGANPLDMAITPDGDRAVVVSGGAPSISIIDTGTRQVVDTLSLGGRQLSAVEIDPDGSVAYLTSFTTDEVVVLDLFDLELAATIPVGDGPTDLAVAPGGNDLYVVNATDASVSIVDLFGLVEVDTILGTPGDGYRYITLDPSSPFIAYVTADEYVWVVQVSDAFEIDRAFVSQGRPERVVARSDGLLFVALSGASPGVGVLENVEGYFQTFTISLPGEPRDLALVRDQTELWVVGGLGAPYFNAYNALSQTFDPIAIDPLPATPYRLVLPPGF